jgi:hypothetical protein
VFQSDGVSDGIAANTRIVIYFNPIEDYRLPRVIGEIKTDVNGEWKFSIDYSQFYEMQGELIITTHKSENVVKVWYTIMPFVIPINKPTEIKWYTSDKPF